MVIIGTDVHKRTHTFVAVEALRCLKRRLSRVVFTRLHTDEHTRRNPHHSDHRDAA
ncbi:hypothetical protein [Mycobacterium neumannii]|uniref:hypothetical protein n=1 Tax=Mycobacterium neumannii TaxID=2048551 RepID=UPI003AB2972D